MKDLKTLLIFLLCFLLLLSCNKETLVNEPKVVEMNIFPKIRIEGKGESFPKQLITNETFFEDIECEMVIEIMTDKFSIWFGKTLATTNFTNDSLLFYQCDFENKVANSDLILNTKSPNSLKPTSNIYTIGWKHAMGQLTFYIKNEELKIEKKFTKQKDELMEMCWGAPYFGVSVGIVNVIESKLKINSTTIPKFAIYGDSFIEGSTMNENLNLRWAYLFSSTVGKQNCPLNGKGGEFFSVNFINRFVSENQWIKSQYVILALGANTSNFEEYKTNLLKTVSIVLQNRQIPILCTSTPSPNNKKFLMAMNDFVKSLNLKYIDFHKALTQKNNPTRWKDGLCLTDSIHPSVRGHEVMYETILNTNFD